MYRLVFDLISEALFMLLPPCRRFSASVARLRQPQQLLSLPVGSMPSLAVLFLVARP